jgi:proline iminopeptidase
MRPVRLVPAANGVTSSSTQRSSSGTTNYIPAQAILTCFYSVNDRFVMNGRNLLDDVDQMQHIPCIAVHGGQDPICPVDSALDLRSVYPSMELRIPLQSGHSMYDPAIINELLMATDYFANATPQHK